MENWTRDTHMYVRVYPNEAVTSAISVANNAPEAADIKAGRSRKTALRPRENFNRARLVDFVTPEAPRYVTMNRP